MNRWQIIGPVGFLAAAVALVLSVIHANQVRQQLIIPQTYRIGRELIATTNSTLLDGVGLGGLEVRLTGLLAYPTQVATVLLGDEPAPIGDGHACSRLILTNAHGDRLGIRLREDPHSERFRVLGFWTITDQSATPTRR